MHNSVLTSGKVSLLCLFEFVFLVSFYTFTSTFLYFSLMSFKSKWTGLFKDKKDNKKARKSTDIISNVNLLLVNQVVSVGIRVLDGTGNEHVIIINMKKVLSCLISPYSQCKCL